MNPHVDIIATTVSGSIKDWGKLKHIIPLFQQHGFNDVSLFTVDTHSEVRLKTCELVKSGNRLIISAGGSGTFNSVLEGCCDAQTDLSNLRLGFLRKGSADLIGKALGMPDEITNAIEVFVKAIHDDKVIPCDVIRAWSEKSDSPARHFVGYGGAEIFGDIPFYTENRFIKYYKGVLSQLFGDLGPFFVGTNMAVLARIFRQLLGKKRRWEIIVDDEVISEGFFQVMIIANGNLGPDLPFARSTPLGSGDFHLFTIRDNGTIALYKQMKQAFKGSIQEDPERWQFGSFRVNKNLVLKSSPDDVFPINVDGSTMECLGSVHFEIVDQIHLFTR